MTGFSSAGADRAVACFNGWHEPDGPAAGLALIGADGRMVCHWRGRQRADGPMAGPDTLFFVSSVAKTVTALLIHRLARAGHLSLSQDLRALLPGLRLPVRVPLAALLSMTSGLLDGPTVRLLTGHDAGPPDGAGWRAVLDAGIVPVDPVGGRFLYTHLNYVLAVLAAEAATGRSRQCLLAEEIARPLTAPGLRLVEDRAAADSAERAGMARGHAPFGAGLAEVRSWGVFGPSGLAGRLADLARLAWALRDNGPAAALSWPTRLTDGTTLTYGQGLRLDRLHGLTVRYHGGMQPGSESVIAWLPDYGLGLVYTVARSGIAIRPRLARLIERICDLPSADGAPTHGRTGPVSGSTTAGGAGRYMDPQTGETLTLGASGAGGLDGDLLGLPVALHPVAGGAYESGFGASAPTRLAPDRDGSFTLHWGGRRSRLVRLPDQRPPAPAVDPAPYVGRYSHAATGAVHTVSADDDGDLTITYGPATAGQPPTPSPTLTPLAADYPGLFQLRTADGQSHALAFDPPGPDGRSAVFRHTSYGATGLVFRRCGRT
ncbi:MAG: serine hydrolase domain-containing protein [Alphaproteobacteria bacterium]